MNYNELNKFEKVIYSDLCCDFERADWLELAMAALDQACMGEKCQAKIRKQCAEMLNLWDDISFGDTGVAPWPEAKTSIQEAAR